MKRHAWRVAPLAALLLCGHVAYGQGPLGAKPKRARTPDDYKPRTLKDLAAAGAGAASRGNKEETMVVHGDTLPSRARAAYAGSARPLPEAKREVLRQWARLHAGFPEGYTGPYQSEVRFVEDGVEYWLAVRKEALPRFGRELKRGEAADLYLIRVGAAKSPEGWEPVLLLESFKKPD